MFFIIVWSYAFFIAVPGFVLCLYGLFLLYQKKPRKALVYVIIGLGMLFTAFASVGWSIYEINTYCPMHPGDCA